MTGPARVALALGGGGARGYAHIGVIDVLEERGYQIVSIAGTSMGALVGGLHAAGRLAAYTDWVRGLTQRDVLRTLDPTLRGAGAIRAEKILARMTELLDGAVIEQLPIPFTAVATDLLSGREVWFQEGPVDQAIRASIAFPGLITPVMSNGRLLADGGLLNPVPVSATSSARADLLVAVSLAGERHGAPEPAEDPTHSRQRSALDVMTLSFDAMQALLTRYQLAARPPDVMVTVPKDACRTVDFHKAQPLIALGRRLAAEALDGADRGHPT